MLRLVLANALVATALSAPTWTQQLGQATTTQLADQTSCQCTNCTDSFISYGGPVSFRQCAMLQMWAGVCSLLFPFRVLRLPTLNARPIATAMIIRTPKDIIFNAIASSRSTTRTRHAGGSRITRGRCRIAGCTTMSRLTTTGTQGTVREATASTRGKSTHRRMPLCCAVASVLQVHLLTQIFAATRSRGSMVSLRWHVH